MSDGYTRHQQVIASFWLGADAHIMIVTVYQSNFLIILQNHKQNRDIFRRKAE